MIATITLNPSVDIRYAFTHLERNRVNRCSTYQKTAGGKGINVSRVLAQLGSEVIATGFLGGFTGQLIEKELEQLSIHPKFVRIAEETRNCIAILSGHEQTEILEAGPEIRPQEGEQFLNEYDKLLKNYPLRVVAASGSIPRGLPANFYAPLIQMAKAKNVKFLLDTSGSALEESIRAAPYLIKPNINELEAWAGQTIKSEEALFSVLGELKAYGLEMVVVSLGAEGCIALCGNQLYRVHIPSVNVSNPVGSGDALVAGMSHAIAKKSPVEEVLRIGVTCGTLNAMNEKTGAIQTEKFDHIYRQVRIEIIGL